MAKGKFGYHIKHQADLVSDRKMRGIETLVSAWWQSRAAAARWADKNLPQGEWQAVECPGRECPLSHMNQWAGNKS